MDSISERIKSLRESKRIRQSEIAAALDVDNSNYAKLERRGKKLTLEQLEKIATALGLSVFELLGSTADDVDMTESNSDTSKLIQALKEEINSLKAVLKREKEEKAVFQASLQMITDLYNAVFRSSKSITPLADVPNNLTDEQLATLKAGIVDTLREGRNEAGNNEKQ